ncbi:MAG: hypothetical protein MPN21_11380 [Thermoanaerobaculia bacterium]|nr:hypothetical protein [Thermoanaerobaculia bacterium]
MPTSSELPTSLWMIVLALFCLALPARAEENQPTETSTPPSLGYQEQVDRFFATLEDGDFGKAFDALYSGNPWIQPDDLSQIRRQFESLPELVGQLHHHELLSKQSVTDRFVYLWYVGHFDRSPVSLYFKFYRPQDAWRFYSFEYKEDLGKVAGEMAMRQMKAGGAPTEPPE